MPITQLSRRYCFNAHAMPVGLNRANMNPVSLLLKSIHTQLFIEIIIFSEKNIKPQCMHYLVWTYINKVLC